MSSSGYDANLKPDSNLRNLLFGAILLLAALGVAGVAALPIEPWLRAIIGCSWLVCSLRQCREVRAAQGRLSRVRVVADGSLQVCDHNDQWSPAGSLGNCVVLRRFAWLTMHVPDGTRHLELVAGNSRESEQWRRLQVIWRHLG